MTLFSLLTIALCAFITLGLAVADALLGSPLRAAPEFVSGTVLLYLTIGAIRRWYLAMRLWRGTAPPPMVPPIPPMGG